jgi:hypothetical protein
VRLKSGLKGTFDNDIFAFMIIRMGESAPTPHSSSKAVSADILHKRTGDEKAREGIPSPWLTDPLGYYQEYYPGVTRGKLKSLNRTLYDVLTRRGLLEELPLLLPNPWLADPWAYYLKHYPGVTRGRLALINNALHTLLKRRGLLKELPLRYDGDPIGYYNEHYPGVTSAELRKRNPALYKVLYGRKFFERRPRIKKEKRLSTNSPKKDPWLDDPKKYYEKRYAGMTRTQLLAGDEPFYRFLKRKNWIVPVPTR